MADGLPGAPKKYLEGFGRINADIPNQLIRPLEEFCKKHNLTKTDIITMAINYVIMAPDEREAKLRQSLFLLDAARKELAEAKEANSKLQSTIAQLRAKPEKIQPLQSIEARQFLESTKERIQKGDLSKSALLFRLEHLRAFSVNKSLPESQRAEIFLFLESTKHFQVDEKEMQKAIRHAEAQGSRPHEISRPTIQVYDFTK
ncbi:MAG: hypothetical protein PHU04_05705, partial [Candidatus Peribacteraceae bacterium]|nr:hypothetical protein [Candidatus Peribacteraceae bacterium]